jgi:hypothetical protein
MAEASRQNDKHLVIQTEEVIQVVGRNLGEKGDPGVGLAGESAPGWNPAGEWDSATAYAELDVVVHTTADDGDGSAYICLQANTNQPPAASPSYWAMIVQAVEGPQGPGGEDMTSAVEVGVWRGAWNSGTSYSDNDLVRYEGSTYICADPHTASNSNKPGSGAGKWGLFAQKGATGPAGPRGEQGERGNTGPAGPQGEQGPRGTNGANGSNGSAGADGADAPVGLSLGPWTEARTLGFLNRSGFSIVLSNELKDGTGTVEWRRKNGSSASLPVTLANGDLYEVRVEGVSGRCYLGYKAERA